MSTIDTVVQIENSSNGQPVWIDTQESLFWIEHNHQRLYRYHEPTGKVSYTTLDTPIISLSPSVKNGFIAALKDGIGFYDIAKKEIVYISKPEPFFNQAESTGGIADREGNYWTTTSHSTNSNKHSHVYQLSPSLDIDRFTHQGINSAAEPAFSRDGKTLYQSAKDDRYIYATKLDENKQPISTNVFCKVVKSEGQPHGLCVDSEDNLWVCHLGGGCISCFDSSGTRIKKIVIQAADVMHCTFGGKNLDTLFITTNGVNLNLQRLNKGNMVGAILTTKPGMLGLNTSYFSG